MAIDNEMPGWLQWLLSAIGGALAVLVAFRTNIALINKRIDSRKEEIERLEETLFKRLGAIERKQSLMLEMVADIARKVGVDSRFSDAIIRFLSEETRDANSRAD